MRQKAEYLRWLFIGLLMLTLGVSATLVAYNLGYSDAATTVPSYSSPVRTRVVTTTLEIALDPVVQALKGQATSPLMLQAEIITPDQDRPTDQTDEKLRFALFSSVLTLAASLLTALLGYVYSHFASKESRQFEWAKYVWGKYEQGYLEFARVLRATLDPNVVRTSFDSLRRTAHLPPRVREKIDAYIKQLESGEGPEQKAAQRETLLSEFEAFLQHPWRNL